MSPTTLLEIKVIYSAAGRTRKRRAPAEPTSHTSVIAKPFSGSHAPTVVRVATKPHRRWIVLGLLNILVAGGFYYGTWWKADKFIYWTFVWKTPVPGMNIDLLMQQLFPGYTAAAALDDGRPESEVTGGSHGEDVGEDVTAEPHYTGETATKVIAVTAYGWLTVSTVSLCALALAGGNALVRVGGAQLRRIGLILAFAGALFLIWQTYDVYSRYKTGYQPDDLRAGMGAMTIWFVLVGLAFNRAHIGVMRLAAIALIVAGACTTLAVYLGHQCGVIEKEWAGPVALLLVFIAHSFYGWILLPVSGRLNR